MKLLEKMPEQGKFDSIDDYYNKIKGTYEAVIPEQNHDSEYPVEICVIKPSKEHPYYVLATKGLSNFKIDYGKHFFKKFIPYCEVMMYLPKDWQVFNMKPEYNWPILMIRDVIKQIIYENKLMGFGTVTDNSAALENSPYKGSVIIYNKILEEVEIDKNKVNFYTIVPITSDEIAFANEKDGEKLFSNMVDNGMRFPAVVDLKRKNATVSSKPQKKLF